MKEVNRDIKEDKFKDLLSKENSIERYYKKQDNGFYKLIKIENRIKKDKLKKIFEELEFTALNFTDSRSAYQFYPLDRLWEDTKLCLKNNIKLWHPATEPILAKELYEYVVGKIFINELGGKPFNYDYRTLYDGIFNGENGYILNKNQILELIKNSFIGENIGIEKFM